jgi:hypothetical protein
MTTKTMTSAEIDALIRELDPKTANLLAGRIIGTQGGKVKSPAKAEASRRNGLKGGRPRKLKQDNE